MFLYDGLNKEIKNFARADPRTGQAWTDYDALARYLITVEISSGTSDVLSQTPMHVSRESSKHLLLLPLMLLSRSLNFMQLPKGGSDTDQAQLFLVMHSGGNSWRSAIGGGKRGPDGQHSGPPHPRRRPDNRAGPAHHHASAPGGFDLRAAIVMQQRSRLFGLPLRRGRGNTSHGG